MEGMNYPPKISLAAARVNAGMLQEVAAIKLHVTAETLRSWERETLSRVTISSWRSASCISTLPTLFFAANARFKRRKE